MSRAEIGGQAVIEGVMMRTTRALVVACRGRDGRVVLARRPWRTLWPTSRFLRWPVARGARALCEAMTNGIGALTYSVDVQAGVAAGARDPGRPLTPALAPRPRIPPAALVASSVVVAAMLFVALPHALAGWVGAALGFDASTVAFHVLDGGFKLAVLLAYILAIARLPDVRRVFAYHGAEHKAIAAHEAGLPLTVEAARGQSRLHARCGTSFVVLVVTIAALLSTASLSVRLADAPLVDHLLKVGLKIPLLVPVAGLAYELLKFAARRPTSWLARALALPGLLMQRLTTREPDDDQIEVALVALRAALADEASVAGDDAALVRAA